MSLLQEFRKFAMRGNVIDMAVGIIIGGAFGKIVTSMVNDILTPIISIFTGGINFSQLATQLKETGDGEPLMLKWGNFLQTTIDFLIIAVCIFVMIKIINTAQKQFEQEQEGAGRDGAPGRHQVADGDS